MLFKKTVAKIPYIGNLVKTSYLVYNKALKNFSAVVQSNSVRLYDTRSLFGKDYDGLIISNSELHEAHVRFINYAFAVSREMMNIPIGKFVEDYPVKTKRPGNPVVKFYIIFLNDNDHHLGYMFTAADLKSICLRTDKVRNSIKRPRWYQRILLWFDRLK